MKKVANHLLSCRIATGFCDSIRSNGVTSVEGRKIGDESSAHVSVPPERSGSGNRHGDRGIRILGGLTFTLHHWSVPLSTNRRVELFLLGTVVVWAMNFTVVKFSLQEMDPMSFNSFRFVLAIGSMVLILSNSGQKLKVHRGDWPRLIGLGLLGHQLYQLLFILGLNWTFAANGAVMLGTTPVWVALATRLVFREPLRWSTWAGIVIAVLGVWLIMEGSESGLTLKATTIKGDLTVLLAAVVFGLFTFLSRPMLGRYTPIQLTTLVMVIGGPMVVLAGIPWILETDISGISWKAWVGVIYSGVLSIAVAFMIWNYGIRQVGAVRTSTFQNLVPVMGLIFGVVLLSEALLPLQYVGAAFTIVGIVLARRTPAA